MQCSVLSVSPISSKTHYLYCRQIFSSSLTIKHNITFRTVLKSHTMLDWWMTTDSTNKMHQIHFRSGLRFGPYLKISRHFRWPPIQMGRRIPPSTESLCPCIQIYSQQKQKSCMLLDGAWLWYCVVCSGLPCGLLQKGFDVASWS